MKLILNGGGTGNQVADARRLLNELIDHDKKILYIPFAWPDQTYSGCLEFMTNEFTRKSGVGKIIGTEIYLKTNVLKDYFNVQKFKFQNELLVDSDNGSDFDLKQLYQQLDELLNQHKKISEQIEIVQHIIAEKNSIENKNGTIEKK